MTMPIFVVRPMPTAADADTVNWTDICHNKNGFIFVSHEANRSPSRWTYAENKRPFIVYRKYPLNWHRLGASTTLTGALKIAKRNAAPKA